MKRFVAAATVVAAGLVGSVALAAPASAEPSLCLHVSIDVNGQGQSQDICLPPAG